MSTRKYPECTPWFIPFPKNQSFARQSIEIEQSKKSNETAAWGFFDMTSSVARKNLLKVFESGYQYPKKFAHPDFNSGYKKSYYSYPTNPTLHPTDEDSGSKPCLGHRPLLSLNPPVYAPQYEWMSYEDVDRKRRELGSALIWFSKRVGRDVVPNGKVKDEMAYEMDTVCVWAGNSLEWQLVDLACQAYAKVVTALYDSSSNDTVEFIMNHAESRILFLTIDHLSIILQLYPKLSYLQGVVLLHSDKELEMYDANGHGHTVTLVKSWAKSLGVDIWGLEEFARIGAQHLSDPIDVEPEAIYSLCYTSGTTGQPKAAILTHGQVALTSACTAWGMEKPEPSITLSGLPLAHVYQRMMNSSALNQGGAVGFTQPNPLFLLEDMRLLKPTVVAAVPRWLNRFYQGVTARFAGGGVKTSLFNHAVKMKLEALRKDGRIEHPIWDKIFFNKIQALMGGNVEIIICGSAATSPDVLDFTQIAFKCRVYSGYGLTETYAVGLRVLSKDPLGSYSVGTPFPCMEIKLVDVEELGYFVRGTGDQRPRGEIRKARNIRSERKGGYIRAILLKLMILVDSKLLIVKGQVPPFPMFHSKPSTPHKQNITKLSHGEFVALEQVESLYSASSAIAQLFVYGDSMRDYLVAIVVPAEGSSSNPTDLKTFILHALDEQAKVIGLKGYEKIRNVHITNELFSVEGGTMTPTLKIRRKDAYMMYKDVIEELYKMPVPALEAKVKL